jgi:alpha-1,2-mannosyltransferase
MPGTETVRFRRPTTGPNAVQPKEIKKDEFGKMAAEGWKRRHQGILQDQVGRCDTLPLWLEIILMSGGRQQRGPFIPSFSVAVRMLLLIRAAGAMYNVISDCDEGESPSIKLYVE